MKLWRVAAIAALVSTLTVITAAAFPLDARWTAIPGSANPAEGPTVSLVRGDADTLTAIVHWNCGQSSSCIVTGDQFMFTPQITIVIMPENVDTPAQYFMVQQHSPGCTTPFGDDAIAGLWFQGSGEVVMQQCFQPASSRYRMRSQALPPVRRVQPPPNLPEMTATARERARARARTTP